MVVITKAQIIHTTTHNLASAGIISREEMAGTVRWLNGLELGQIIRALVESHDLLEECADPQYVVGDIHLN